MSIEAFRKEARTWLEANCPLSMRQPIKDESDIFWGGRVPKFKSEDQKIWFERMVERGWTVPHWPKEYGGGGLSKTEANVLNQEMRRIQARQPLFSFGIAMLGPALLQFGSEEQKLKYLPEIVQGKIWWCQGYSEPNAGSDLAALQTKAEDRGDHYLVNGQKVWTSYADRADWIFCLVRTNFESSKHNGISFLLIDMTAEGVSTRPIKLISGKSPFCETFFDNVKVPKENLVGVENKGWTIAKYLLTHERGMIGGLSDTQDKTPLSQYAIQHIGKENGKLADPLLRRDIAALELDLLAFDQTIRRAKDEAKAGKGLGAKSSMFKYLGTEMNKRRLELMIAAAGTDGLEWESEASKNGALARAWLRTKGNSIEGGTSEIQLNILSKRVLGLPSR